MTRSDTARSWPGVWLVLLALGAGIAGCTPTVRVQVAPITINAKLEADVRVRLDKAVQSAIAQNPNLF